VLLNIGYHRTLVRECYTVGNLGGALESLYAYLYCS